MRFFSRRRSSTDRSGGGLLDEPLLHLSGTDDWRIRDACEGLQVFGGTGSGKTSGSGKAVATAFLRQGFGGLILTAKADEPDLWRRYCEETGRLDDLIVIGADCGERFNFLDYEATRRGGGAGLTQNVTQLFMSVLEVLERRQGGNTGDPFWDRAMKQLFRNATDLVLLSGAGLSLASIYDIIISAPQNLEEVHDEQWQRHSFCFRCIEQGHEREKDVDQENDFAQTVKFWLKEFAGLSSRTRSNVVATFSSMADLLLRGVPRRLFCTDTTVTPDMCFEGRIILLDLPVKEFADVGQMAQTLFKYSWQRAVERRVVGTDTLPCFLWADESQLFATSFDAVFQTTARSSRICTVYLTQNLGIYRSTLGQPLTDSLMGNLMTKIFHANSEPATNQWASEVIARSWQFRGNVSTSLKGGGAPGEPLSRSAGASDTLEYDILPQEFTTLRKGGSDNDCCVDGILFQGGRKFKSGGRNYLKITFEQ